MQLWGPSALGSDAGLVGSRGGSISKENGSQ